MAERNPDDLVRADAAAEARPLRTNADRRVRLLRRALLTVQGGCRVIHGSEPAGTTCRDKRQDAWENPHRYGWDYRQKLIAGLYLCDGCVIDEALEQEAAEFEREEADHG